MNEILEICKLSEITEGDNQVYCFMGDVSKKFILVPTNLWEDYEKFVISKPVIISEGAYSSLFLAMYFAFQQLLEYSLSLVSKKEEANPVVPFAKKISDIVQERLRCL